MARERYRIEWVILGSVLAVIMGLLVIFGPGLYRKGKGVVGPIVELARSDNAIEALNQELPFVAPSDGLVSEERLEVFLAVRRGLIPHYENWQETVDKVEKEQGESSWEGAKEVLEETREVFRAQVELLKESRMSPAEFRWLEDEVYGNWWAAVTDQGNGESPESVLNRKNQTSSDLELLDDLVERHGSSPLADEMKEHLAQRLAVLENPTLTDLEGVPDENEELFRARWEEISSLDLKKHSLHARLRDEDVRIHLDETGTTVEAGEEAED